MTSSFLATAHALASRLAAEAVTGAPDGPRWTGADVVGDEAHWSIAEVDVGDDVYGGRAGLAWFLGLAAASGAPDAGNLRHLSLAAALSALRSSPAAGDGLLVGAIGRVRVAIDLGRRLGDTALVEEALACARVALAGPVSGDDPDLLAGTAGAVLGLLTLAPDLEEAAPRARALGDVLVARADKQPWGWSWASSPAPGEPALCGLAHGAAGIALALVHLSRATGEPAFAEAAHEAARYERSWFSQAMSNWPDLRRSASEAEDSPPTYPVFWCHGAGGIGLARLHAAAITGDEAAWADATAAVNAGRVAVAAARHQHESGLPSDQSLCHGLAGVVELFLVAAEVTGRPEHVRAARRTGELSLAMTAAHGGVFACGLPDRREAPGLFLGLAGIGVTALRLHDPSLAPSPALFGVPAVPGRARVGR